METSQNPMKPTGKELGNVIFWFKNQVAFTFRSKQAPAAGKQQIIDELPLDRLNLFLSERRKVRLQSFGKKDVPRPRGATVEDGEHEGDLRDPTAKYLFRSPEGDGSVLVAFFQVVPEEEDGKDHTLDVVNLFNNKEFLLEDGLPPTAMPNWLGAGTGDVGHGCPITPPIPVDVDAVCADSPGYWPISVPLPADLQQANGAGVTVFVLDAFPKPETIDDALAKVLTGANGLLANRLLQDMATNMVVTETPFPPMSPATSMATLPAINLYYPSLPGDEDPSGESLPKTGKDIDGNLIGYPMADHGLFVAGIIRSLAPAANIVCIRVLNDFGVGDTAALLQTLEAIANHVGTDLPLPLIINMSMVVTPYDDQLPCLGLEGELSSSIRDGLQVALQTLTNFGNPSNPGVILVAAAGNDSDSRSTMVCMPPMTDEAHLGPRYPAAFADSIPQVISVGAIDGSGQPANYSNYPGANGVATYGGGLPEKDNTKSQPGDTEAQQPIDGLRGLYTTPYLPALSKDDANSSTTAPAGIEYPEKDVPNNNAWAYWSGTSFATPIIAGLTALVLQAEAPASVDVRQHVIALAGTQTVSWQAPDSGVPIPGPVIYAQPCPITELNSQAASES